MYKLCFFVPESHLEPVKSALFALGAGKIGHYDCCAWQVAGQGQFRALEGSMPFIGQHGVVASVDEYRVEMVVSDELIASVVETLVEVHPYEVPAYEYWPVNASL
ncbi:NGG1p interacting factor NIF3 [Pseudomonadales bacterium]|nr:NGG1p interacting factor NIF3 [Pseudomonadales bacterium]